MVVVVVVGAAVVVVGAAVVVVADDRDPLVVFVPSGKRGRFPRGTPVLEAARSIGVDIDSVCGGRAICGRCQVEVAEGDLGEATNERNRIVAVVG